MKLRTIVAVTLSGAFVAASAAVTGRIDKSNHRCWEEGETPAVTVNIANSDGVSAEAAVVLSLSTDTWQPAGEYSRKAVVASRDSASVTFEMPALAPGFYRVKVTVDGAELPQFNIGYNPTAIVSPADRQPDFSEFWQQALGELAAVAPEYKLTRDPYRSSADKNVYMVEMKSLPDTVGGEPVVIRGFYSEPVAPGCYPVLITYQGYDGHGTSPVLSRSYWSLR